eukprot:3468415-Prymnesium_polylepis.1
MRRLCAWRPWCGGSGASRRAGEVANRRRLARRAMVAAHASVRTARRPPGAARGSQQVLHVSSIPRSRAI